MEANTTCIPVDPQIRSNPLETESQNQTIRRGSDRAVDRVSECLPRWFERYYVLPYVQRRAEGVDTRLTPAATPISTVDFLGR